MQSESISETLAQGMSLYIQINKFSCYARQQGKSTHTTHNFSISLCELARNNKVVCE